MLTEVQKSVQIYGCMGRAEASCTSVNTELFTLIPTESGADRHLGDRSWEIVAASSTTAGLEAETFLSPRVNFL